MYAIRPRYEAQAAGGKVVGLRWVHSAKNGGVRSRLVCQDFNKDAKRSDDMFAPTPPLMSSRWLLSRMASQGLSGPGSMRLMGLDFSKAFLYGDMQRQVLIDLPDEDARKFQGDFVGLLKKSMYGLRDAPQIWQKVVRDMLVKRGYKALLGTQCTYVHPGTKVVIVAHLDDFLVLGTQEHSDRPNGPASELAKSANWTRPPEVQPKDVTSPSKSASSKCLRRDVTIKIVVFEKGLWRDATIEHDDIVHMAWHQRQSPRTRWINESAVDEAGLCGSEQTSPTPKFMCPLC